MNIPTEVREIPVEQVRVMVSRARKKEGFEAMKESMKWMKERTGSGLRYPIQVRDLGRRGADGIRYELIVGEGRLTAAKELKWKTIPALMIEAGHEEFAGRFLAENMIRKALPWAQKGRLVRDELKAGGTLAEVADRFHISEQMARKYLRVLDKASTAGLEDEVAAMPMNDAEVFTTLPPKGQKLVLEVAKERDVPIRELSNLAKKIEKETGEGWTKGSLEKALQKFDDDLASVRKRLKVLRLHHSLGPQNVRALLKSKDFLTAATSAKLNLSAFTE